MSLLKKPVGATKSRKRLGRGPGSGLGNTAGRGEKGQNSRSGGGVRPGFEGGQMPLYRRLPRRGFSNYPFKTTAIAINLKDLDSKYAQNEEVSYESLVLKGIIKPSAGYVKILGNGDITKALTIRYLDISSSAAEKIKAAGGTIIDIQDKSDGE